MLERINRYALHPFFMATYPILFLLSVNVREVSIQQAWRTLAVSLSFCLILLLILGMLFKDFRRGGLFASLFFALFFSYGHIHNWLETNDAVLKNEVFLNGLWLALFGFGIWFAYSVRKIDLANQYLNMTMLVLTMFPIFNIGLYLYQSGVSLNNDLFSLKETQTNIQGKEGQPDIYYIILDGYGRSDVVRELYDYDNSSFIQYLQERGFYVAEQSHSNYGQTALSLASSLNYKYLNLKRVDLQSDDRVPLARMIDPSLIRKFLRKRGYQVVAFSTAYSLTTLDRADILIPYKPAGVFNDFESLFFSTTAASTLDPKFFNKWFVDPRGCDFRRGVVLNIFDNLKKVPDLPGPKFVFAHIISPHPPFVFDANGTHTSTECASLLMDGNYFTGGQSNYRQGYAQQIQYIEKLTREAVDTILGKSKTPPVIIIQGDHGPGMLLDWDSSKTSCLRERFSILNAYYLPNQNYDHLYETITPVNSFRVVLNTIFGRNLPLLEDKSYYSRWYTPYQLIDVTDKLEDVCNVKK